MHGMDPRSSRLSRSETTTSVVGPQATSADNRSSASFYHAAASAPSASVAGGGGPVDMERSIYSERDRGYLSDMSSR